MRFWIRFPRASTPSMPVRPAIDSAGEALRLLQMLYSVRREQLRMGEIDYSIRYRLVCGLNLDEAVWMPPRLRNTATACWKRQWPRGFWRRWWSERVKRVWFPTNTSPLTARCWKLGEPEESSTKGTGGGALFPVLIFKKVAVSSGRCFARTRNAKQRPGR
jgi:hypothetical protein